METLHKMMAVTENERLNPWPARCIDNCGGLSAGLDTKTVARKFQNNERQLPKPFQKNCAKMTYYTTRTLQYSLAAMFAVSDDCATAMQP
jgi:hypothetical protein